MDYKSLLSLAEKKSEELKDSNNEFLIRHKLKNGQSLGPNKSVIDAFKARKQREEMERERERQREKDRLLALRAQNSKSVKKALMMKTRTKDNDFSRIVLTDAQIEEQRRVEEKLKRKGTQDITQNEKLRNELEDRVIQNGVKNRNYVKSFNESQKCGKTDRNKDIINRSNKNVDKSSNNHNNENAAKARPPKPALSYEQLLSLAAEKAKSEKKSLSEEMMSEIEEKKQMRPMTQKEKDRLKEELYYKQRASKGLARLPNAEQIKKNTNSREVKRDVNSNRKPINSYNSDSINNKVIPKTVVNSNSNQLKSDKNIKNTNNYNNVSNQRTADISPINRQRVVPPINRQDSRRLGQSSGAVNNKSAIINKMNNRLNIRDKEYNEKYSKNMNASKEPIRRMEPINGNRDRGVKRAQDDRARPPSPPLVRRSLSPPPVRRRQSSPSPPVPTRTPMTPMPKLPPIGSTYRRGMYEDVAQYVVEDEYEEEEDEDMADFIDDGPEEKPEEEDYSKAIREIFGYDKRRYRNVDDDDIEEANFVQCMREDARSARIGLQEDLEEERKEEEEKRLKAMAKKRIKR